MKGVMFAFLISLSIALSCWAEASFDEFPIMAWKPWYHGEGILPGTPGSIPSLKSIGFNSVYWGTNSNHIDTVEDYGMKGYFYPAGPFPELVLSSMNYIFETYTDSAHTVEYNPTAWKVRNVDWEYEGENCLNHYSVEVPEDFTGVILDSLGRSYELLGSYSDIFWGARAIDPTHRTTGFSLCSDTAISLDTKFGIESSCHEDCWCSLDSLCPEYLVIDTFWNEDSTEIDSTDTTYCHKMGYIFYPRIKVASVEGAGHDTLCMIGIADYDDDNFPQNDSQYEWHIIYWDDFDEANVYYDESLKFKVGLRNSRLNIRIKAPDGGTPVTFWIDQIRARDAFANYLNRSAKLFNKASKEN